MGQAQLSKGGADRKAGSEEEGRVWDLHHREWMDAWMWGCWFCSCLLVLFNKPLMRT